MRSVKPELLAPAGSPEALSAALRCGADAVYVGVKEFSARRNAANFSFDELKAGAELCHLYDAKLYVALNTVVTDREYPVLADTIKRSAEAGADAFIVQDIGAARLMREIIPDMPLHASTQMTIHTPAGVSLARELGFSRVVAARELSRNELAKLCAMDTEIEIFVHGALCISVSGQCYMSALIGGRSANRGLCAQACRLPASVRSGGNEYALSLKDLSLVKHIGEIVEMGASSLKIEGRMKRPEYVAAAVTAIRAALDGGEPDMETLRAVFSRGGFTDGYFTGKRGGAMFGVRSHEDVTAAAGALPKLARLYAYPRRFVNVDITVNADSAAMSDGGSEVRAKMPPVCDMPPLQGDRAIASLSKLGGSIYCAGSIKIPDNICLPVSSLNAIRRELCAALDSERRRRNTPDMHINSYTEAPRYPHVPAKKAELRVQLLRGQKPQLSDDIAWYYVPLEDAAGFPLPERMIIVPPRFIIDESALKKRLAPFSGGHILCANPAYIALCRESFFLHGGFGLNLASTASLEEAERAGLCDAIVSPELTLKQVQTLGSDIPRGIIAYGRLPFMLTRNCPISSDGVSCADCCGFITDRTGRNLPVRCGDGCAEIFNSDCLWLADKREYSIATDFAVLLLQENDDLIKLAKAYREGAAMPQGATRCLYFRGVE